MYKKLLSTGLFLVLFGASFVSPALAETKPGYSATISPGKKFFELLPGQSAEYMISYTNNLENVDKQQFEIRVHDFYYDETGAVQFIDPSEVSDLSKSMNTWVRVPDDVSVSGGQKVQIPIRVTVPADAPAGDKYGIVLVRSKPPEGSGAVGVQGQLASLIILKVKGEKTTQKSGDVKDLKIASREKARNTVNFEFLYENTSQEFYTLRTVVDVYESEESLSPLKSLKNVSRVFPNVPKQVKIPLGDLGDDYGDGTYFARILMQEESTSDTPKVFGRYEETFDYFVPLRPDQPEVKDQVGDEIEKVVHQGPSLADMVKEIVLYVGGLIIVLLILVRVLFFGKGTEKKKKA